MTSPASPATATIGPSGVGSQVETSVTTPSLRLALVPNNRAKASRNPLELSKPESTCACVTLTPLRTRESATPIRRARWYAAKVIPQ